MRRDPLNPLFIICFYLEMFGAPIRLIAPFDNNDNNDKVDRFG